ncbi:MAG: hypothetical protein ACRDPC_06245 [Solirubrobacteraceae bacterium]
MSSDERVGSGEVGREAVNGPPRAGGPSETSEVAGVSPAAAIDAGVGRAATSG